MVGIRVACRKKADVFREEAGRGNILPAVGNAEILVFRFAPCDPAIGGSEDAGKLDIVHRTDATSIRAKDHDITALVACESTENSRFRDSVG